MQILSFPANESLLNEQTIADHYLELNKEHHSVKPKVEEGIVLFFPDFLQDLCKSSKCN